MKTVICHFYNEEYLLPFWLRHHKKYFDFGIMIDYASTDNSVNIIKEICPNWQIIPSGFAKFDAVDCDFEVMFIERQLSGWRIALTATEFIVGNVNKLMVDNTDRKQWLMPCVIFAEYDPERVLDHKIDLWRQATKAIPYTTSDSAKLCRSLHNFNDIRYTPGRHFMPHNTEDALIFKFSNFLVGKPMIDRRLQIQNKVSDRDKQSGCADHHIYANGGGLTETTLPQYFKERLEPLGIIDCTELIDTYS